MAPNEAPQAAVHGMPPAVPDERHPVETTRYVLLTRPIEEFVDAVISWLENRSPGGIVHGRPRVGKTRAIMYLVRAVGAAFDSLPVTVLPCRKHQRPSEAVFFEELLRAAGHPIRTGTVTAKRDRLIEHWYEMVQTTSQNRLLLVIDDAQRLHPDDYQWLMDCHNDLDAAGVYLIAVLVGQRELVYRRSILMETKQFQIVGRFMTQEHEFRGLRSPADVRRCLQGYDEDAEYPPGSGWSFTRFFFPVAFLNGSSPFSCVKIVLW